MPASSSRPNTGERLAHLETLLEDPELGLIAHVKRVEKKTDTEFEAVNTKLDRLLEERAERKPFFQVARTAGAGFVGAVAMYVAALVMGFPLPKHS